MPVCAEGSFWIHSALPLPAPAGPAAHAERWLASLSVDTGVKQAEPFTSPPRLGSPGPPAAHASAASAPRGLRPRARCPPAQRRHGRMTKAWAQSPAGQAARHPHWLRVQDCCSSPRSAPRDSGCPSAQHSRRMSAPPAAGRRPSVPVLPACAVHLAALSDARLCRTGATAQDLGTGALVEGPEHSWDQAPARLTGPDAGICTHAAVQHTLPRLPCQC